MKVAIISGASRGIGREIALSLAKSGFDIAILSLKNDKLLDETRKKIIQLGRRCISSLLDISNFNECENFINTVVNKFGKIDVLINNCGISYIGLVQDMTTDDFDKIMKTNFYSCFYMSKLVIPHMLKNKSGKIINISSIWGKKGASMEVAYSASKGAINSFTKALAKELAPSNIQVNAIAPGYIDTDMNADINTDIKKLLFDEIPSGRAGEALEVAELATYIANSNTYLSGQIIGLDGAWE